MSKLVSRFAWLLLPMLAAGICNRLNAQKTNDDIFPPAAAAKEFVNFDKHGFIIKGQRVFLVSAGLEYARIPHELWRDRLLRLKRAGFNCIEIYTFWNYHEPQEGRFDFTGDHDLNAFLRLVKQLDMYAIVRVGPYYCAEWDFGGYPIWLRFKEGLRVREPNAVFEAAVDRFFEQLMPIVNANQVHRGGAVILVQLENEHPKGWGTDKPDAYFAHLQSKAVSLGLEVPYFFSGLHHGSDPAGDNTQLDAGKRNSPWFSTEFWSVWYNYYGSSQKDADTYARRTWKIIAHGGNGYNYYMAHGGTNFGYTNNNEDAASYDYGAAVGQTGDLRPVYTGFKRAAYFARSFQFILGNSEDASDAYKSFTKARALHVSARHSGSSDLVFLDNRQDTAVPTQVMINRQWIPQHGPLIVAPGEIVPLVHNITLTNTVKLDWAVGRILGLTQQGPATTLVIYGKPGTDAELQFTTLGKVDPVTGIDGFNQVSNNLFLQIAFNRDHPVNYSFETGKQLVRVIALSDSLAARTWFAGTQGKQYIIIGAPYAGEVTTTDAGKIQVDAEQFWTSRQPTPVWIYGSDNRPFTFTLQPAKGEHATQLPMSQWQVKDASTPAAAAFDDHTWKQSNDALQMGADGDISADAWYRTTVNITNEGVYTLQAKDGGDRATVFADGQRVAAGNLHEDALSMQLTAGKHTLAVFTAHDGRDKLFNHLGPVADTDPKGLSGAVLLHKGAPVRISNWKIIPAAGTPNTQSIPAFDTAAIYTIGADAFDGKAGYAWFQATIPAVNGSDMLLHFKGVDDNVTVFINGKAVAQHTGYNTAFDVPLKDVSGAATLTLLVQNTGGSGGIHKQVELTGTAKEDIALTGWRMQGGPGDVQSTDRFTNLQANTPFDKPMLYRNSFFIDSINTAIHPVWRITINGLGHGSVWVNGRNLGRYPEKIPVNSLYIPECWLHKGANTVVVFDEDGQLPVGMRVEAEMASSRDIQSLVF
ncbi:beta-galactosidase [Deminuibacter soli]|uniref:Uncharacterized protein n=1 Tax=Deminuibacter soli TaxID=2291815 RepID=A0A3E1NP02_9BACT|nr:beta-galactosidase [Deminuibacter soli]RFM29518.1 hypothetical protein DXN05_00595 [Deminuibacter soli]